MSSTKTPTPRTSARRPAPPAQRKKRRSVARSPWLWAGVTVCVVVAGGVGAAYAVDRDQRNVIAKGVRIGGVAVGGLTTAQASAKVDEYLRRPANKPVRVVYRDEVFILKPRRAKVAVDVDGAVDYALAKSQEGGLAGRTLRRVKGDHVNADIDPNVTYSRRAVRRFVDRVGEEIRKDPVNAEVAFTGLKLEKVHEKNGRELRQKPLVRQVGRRLGNPTGGIDRRVRARTRTLAPSVTIKDLAKEMPTALVVNRSGFTVTLWRNLRPVKRYGIAVGQAGFDSPGGKHYIINKSVNPAWSVPNKDWAPADLRGQVIPGGSANNPLKARWMGVTGDGVGFHGTAEVGSIGTRASHGCFRMTVPDIVELYERVPVNTPVYIS